MIIIFLFELGSRWGDGGIIVFEVGVMSGIIILFLLMCLFFGMAWVLLFLLKAYRA